MLIILFQMVILTSLISLSSLYISNQDFLYHSIICITIFILCIIGGIFRNEDKMLPGSGQRRYFMMCGQSSLIAYFLGIIIIYI
jgi:hypothetical protein